MLYAYIFKEIAMLSSQHKKLIQRFFAPLLTQQDILQQLRENTIIAKGHYYFDFTATGLAYRAINKRIESILPYYANTHSYTATNAAFVSELYDKAKESILESLGLDDDFTLIAGGSGASFGIKKFQELMGIYIPPHTLWHLEALVSSLDSVESHSSTSLKNVKNSAHRAHVDSKLTKDSIESSKTHASDISVLLQKLRIYDRKTHLLHLPHIILSGFEHHSNEISYKEGLCHVHKIAFNKYGLPDISHLATILNEIAQPNHRIIASLNAASNVTGIYAPLESYAAILRKHKAIIALDMASSSPYINIESTLFDAAFLAPHKLLGGVGSCGLLAIKERLLDNTFPPSFSGGGVIAYANDNTHHFIANKTKREEAGTPHIIGILYAALAYQLRNEIGLEWIARREKILTEVFLYELSKIPAVSIYGDLSLKRLGIVSFNIGSISPLDLSALLSKKYRIQTRAGCSCAGPYGHYLIPDGDVDKKPMWLRVSLHYTHSVSDVEYLIQAIKECVQILRGF